MFNRWELEEVGELVTGCWHCDEHSNLDTDSTEVFSATHSGRLWNPTSLLSGRYRRLSLEMRSQECEAFDLPPSGTEIDNAWSCTSPPQYVYIAWYVIGTFTTLRLYHNHCKFWYTFNSILDNFFFARLLICTYFKIDPFNPQVEHNFILRFGTSFLQFDVFSTVHHSIGLFLQPTWMHTSI